MATISFGQGVTAFFLQDTTHVPKDSTLHKVITQEARSEKFLVNTETLDKLWKLFDPLFEAAALISRKLDAREVEKGFEGGRKLLKTARDANAMIAILGGGWRRIGQHFITCIRLVGSLIADTQGANLQEVEEPLMQDDHVSHGYHPKGGVPLKGGHAHFTDIAATRSQKWWALGSEFGKFASETTFVGAFGVCRTAENLKKYGNVHSHTAHQLGAVFPDVMLANHAAGVFASGCQLVYLQLKEEEAREAYKKDKNKGLYDQRVESIDKKIWSTIVTLATKLLEILNSVLKKLQLKEVIPPVPHWVGLPLNGIIGLLSLYGLWLKTP